ncbi:hypothetical protein K2X83_03045 [Patescibacteria group bacterium]|nr:hypothetical protein [Patescibacteria group bacterium]
MESIFESILAKSKLVGYVPMQDEPDFSGFLSARGLPRADFLIPASKDIEPGTIERELRSRYQNAPVVLFIPGRAFDISGTRHGRGHGWYDRLLATLPEDWLRVGVSGAEHLSKDSLIRQSWDQPVDYLLIDGTDGFAVVETKARGGVVQS